MHKLSESGPYSFLRKEKEIVICVYKLIFCKHSATRTIKTWIFHVDLCYAGVALFKIVNQFGCAILLAVCEVLSLSF